MSRIDQADIAFFWPVMADTHEAALEEILAGAEAAGELLSDNWRGERDTAKIRLSSQAIENFLFITCEDSQGHRETVRVEFAKDRTRVH